MYLVAAFWQYCNPIPRLPVRFPPKLVSSTSLSPPRNISPTAEWGRMSEWIVGTILSLVQKRYPSPNKMARLERLELPTRCLEGSCSIHLSYRRVFILPAVAENRGARDCTGDLRGPRE